MNVFIFHGTGGHPQENWFPWLKQELELLGCKVSIPQFPTPKNQTPATWFPIFENYKKEYRNGDIVIGHSLGGAFLLRVLERYPIIVKAAYTVGSPIGVLPIKYYKGDKPFIAHPFDWNTIKSRAKTFYVFHSEDDQIVSFGNGEELAKKVGAQLINEKHAGHFNTKSGYTAFELLLEKIKEQL